MTLSSAQQFLNKTREDRAFRHQARSAAAGGGLALFLRRSGFDFELNHLVVAMAACMEQLEQCCDAPGKKTEK